MPAYKYQMKNGKTKWYANFYYTDWLGQKQHKCKRGFDTKRDAQEWKGTSMAYSQAQNRATQKYQKANYDRLAVRCKKGRKEAYEKLASSRGISLNQLIIDLLEKEIENDSQ